MVGGFLDNKRASIKLSEEIISKYEKCNLLFNCETKFQFQCSFTNIAKFNISRNIHRTGRTDSSSYRSNLW